MPDNYFARYLPFLIHILMAGGIATAIVLLSWLIGQRKPTAPNSLLTNAV